MSHYTDSDYRNTPPGIEPNHRSAAALYTPGPWQVNKKIKTTVETTVDGQGVNIIAECRAPDGDRLRATDQANARLIAAAPDLLYALRMVAESGPLNNGLKDDATMAIVRKALQKVKV